MPMLHLIRGGALRGGRGENLPSPLMAFFNIPVIDIFTTYLHFTRRGHLACGLFSELVRIKLVLDYCCCAPELIHIKIVLGIFLVQTCQS